MSTLNTFTTPAGIQCQVIGLEWDADAFGNAWCDGFECVIVEGTLKLSLADLTELVRQPHQSQIMHALNTIAMDARRERVETLADTKQHFLAQ